jgi:hypothetical protein
VVALFRDRSTASVFWVIILSIVLHAHFFVHAPQVIVVPEDGLFYILLQPLTVLPGVAIVILYQVVLIIAALRFNYVLNDLRMFNKTAFTTAMSYILLASLFAQWNNLLPAMLIHLMLIWLFNKIARLYHNPHPKTLVFNIGLIAGCIQLLMPSFFTLPIFCLLALTILRPFRPDEWVILLLGIITPFYFLAIVLFLNDNLADILDYFPFTRFHKISFPPKETLLINSILLFLFVVGGFIIWQKNTSRMLIQSRRNWGVLFLFILFVIPVLFVYRGNWLNVAFLFVLPFSALASNIFLYPRKIAFPMIFFLLTVAAIVYNNWIA